MSFFVQITIGISLHLILLILPCRWDFHSPYAKLAVLDVGQGDAVLLLTKEGRTILFDGGPDRNILRELPKELPFFERRIDLVLLSHPHADHLDGLLALLQGYSIGGVVLTDVAYNSANYQLLKSELASKNIPTFQANYGEDWHVAENISIDILFPFDSLEGKTFKNANNSSLVAMLHVKEFTCLFTGDAEKELESLISLYYGEKLRSDCLKAGHHGSKTSSTWAFLHNVQPKVTFVSVGKDNKYNHPDHDTLCHLQMWGSVKRTDYDGTIVQFLLQ